MMIYIPLQKLLAQEERLREIKAYLGGTRCMTPVHSAASLQHSPSTASSTGSESGDAGGLGERSGSSRQLFSLPGSVTGLTKGGSSASLASLAGGGGGVQGAS